MRTNDIVQGSKPTTFDMTPELYIRHSTFHPVPMEEQATEQLRRGAGAQDCPYMGVRLDGGAEE